MGISVDYNTPPPVPTDPVTARDRGCATSAPGPTLPLGDVGVSAKVTDPDINGTGGGDPVTGTFAVWPVDDPAARTEQTGHPGLEDRAGVGFPADRFEHGRGYAWAVRASDGAEVSAWSQPCYFTKDNERPAQPPTVSSTDYPDDNNWHSGTGIPGEFTFGPNGVTDIGGYSYSLVGGSVGTYVAAGPDGTATVTVTPQDDGPNRLYVSSTDSAGNRSDQTVYTFRVTDSGPIVEGGITGVGVPSTLTFRPRLDGVVQYRYQFNGEPEQTVAAQPDGTAQVTVTLLTGGLRQLTVTSRTAAGLEAATVTSFNLRTDPLVSSVEYPEQQSSGGIGVPGTFTLGPRMPNVVSYLYSFAIVGPEQSVAADATGQATFTWTPTTAGSHQLRVRSVSADGTRSPFYTYRFTVINSLPEVWGTLYDDSYPYGGPGITGSFYLSSQLAGVTEYVYRFNDGPEQVVVAEFGSAVIDFTPTIGGRHVLEVRSRTAAGVESGITSYPFQVSSANN